MSSNDNLPDFDADSMRQLEEAIFSARDFVRPSTDLRPRTLEQARDASRIHTWSNRLTVTVLAAMLIWSTLITVMRDLGKHREKIAGPFPQEIEQRAESYPHQYPYSPEWRMVDAFQEERNVHGRSKEARRIETRRIEGSVQALDSNSF